MAATATATATATEPPPPQPPPPPSATAVATIAASPKPLIAAAAVSTNALASHLISSQSNQLSCRQVQHGGRGSGQVPDKEPQVARSLQSTATDRRHHSRGAAYSRVAAAHPAPTRICAAYIKSRGCPLCPDSNLRRLRSGTSRTRISTKRRASTSQRATSGRGRVPVGISPVRFFLRTCSDPSFRPPSRTYSWALPSGSCTWKHLPPRPETAAEWDMPTPHAPQCC